MRAMAGGKWQATATGTCNDDCGKLTMTVTYEKLLQEGGHSFGARLLVMGRLLTLRKETYVSEQALDSEARRVEHSVLATLS